MKQETHTGSSSYSATREPDVAAQVNIQDKLTMELTTCAATLEEVLMRVLRSEPVEMVEIGTPNESLVPLAGQLRDHNQRLSNVVEKLIGILKRLEL